MGDNWEDQASGAQSLADQVSRYQSDSETQHEPAETGAERPEIEKRLSELAEEATEKTTQEPAEQVSDDTPLDVPGMGSVPLGAIKQGLQMLQNARQINQDQTQKYQVIAQQKRELDDAGRRMLILAHQLKTAQDQQAQPQQAPEDEGDPYVSRQSFEQWRRAQEQDVAQLKAYRVQDEKRQVQVQVGTYEQQFEAQLQQLQQQLPGMDVEQTLANAQAISQADPSVAPSEAIARAAKRSHDRAIAFAQQYAKRLVTGQSGPARPTPGQTPTAISAPPGNLKQMQQQIRAMLEESSRLA